MLVDCYILTEIKRGPANHRRGRRDTVALGALKNSHQENDEKELNDAKNPRRAGPIKNIFEVPLLAKLSKLHIISVSSKW